MFCNTRLPTVLSLNSHLWSGLPVTTILKLHLCALGSRAEQDGGTATLHAPPALAAKV